MHFLFVCVGGYPALWRRVCVCAFNFSFILDFNIICRKSTTPCVQFVVVHTWMGYMHCEAALWSIWEMFSYCPLQLKLKFSVPTDISELLLPLSPYKQAAESPISLYHFSSWQFQCPPPPWKKRTQNISVSLSRWHLSLHYFFTFSPFNVICLF